MIEIESIDHIGIRVIDAPRALKFYALFGFELTYKSPNGEVLILRNPAGVEINLIVNGMPLRENRNILMDVPEKYTGYTHIALRVRSLAETERQLTTEGIAISEGPKQLGDGLALFVRDPDGNVIELREPLRREPGL